MVPEFIKASSIGLIFIFIPSILLSGVIIDGSMANEERFNGTVIDKHFVDNHSNLQVGTIYDLNGKQKAITTVEYQPDKFTIIVKTKDNAIHRITISSNIYYTTAINDTVNCVITKGFFTGLTWNTYILK
ncbi:hypothetical protein [Aquimarina algiphila]|uniref:hypothetical protein n=1 Tax=Aquimarina algiphila TaxID=2047982 RepID=UPI00232CECB2|nr:hypothetical protein [Aquimarina algiphila]